MLAETEQNHIMSLEGFASICVKCGMGWVRANYERCLGRAELTNEAIKYIKDRTELLFANGRH